MAFKKKAVLESGRTGQKAHDLCTEGEGGVVANNRGLATGEL